MRYYGKIDADCVNRLMRNGEDEIDLGDGNILVLKWGEPGKPKAPVKGKGTYIFTEQGDGRTA